VTTIVSHGFASHRSSCPFVLRGMRVVGRGVEGEAAPQATTPLRHLHRHRHTHMQQCTMLASRRLVVFIIAYVVVIIIVFVFMLIRFVFVVACGFFAVTVLLLFVCTLFCNLALCVRMLDDRWRFCILFL